MSEREDIYSTATRVLSDVGDVDIIVNNAGILRDPGDFLAKPDDTMEKTIRVNLLSHIWVGYSSLRLKSLFSRKPRKRPIQMAKAFLPRMLERDRGHIVCVCSLSGIVGAKGKWSLSRDIHRRLGNC